LKLLNIVDEHTREALTIEVDRSIDADHTVAVLDRLVVERGTAPRFIRCDNGPELTATALRDWCEFTGVGTSYIDPAHPGRTPTSRVSAVGCVTNCSPLRSSAPCWRPRCWSRTGGSGTAPSDPTVPWATTPRPSTLEPGPLPARPTPPVTARAAADPEVPMPHGPSTDRAGVTGEIPSRSGRSTAIPMIAA
jgi:hypothetical protein